MRQTHHPEEPVHDGPAEQSDERGQNDRVPLVCVHSSPISSSVIYLKIRYARRLAAAKPLATGTIGNRDSPAGVSTIGVGAVDGLMA